MATRKPAASKADDNNNGADDNNNGAADKYAALANGASKVANMPKRTTAGSASPLAELVARSYTEGQAFELPPISTDEKEVARVVAALRRAAQSKELGVSIAHEVREGKTVITFKGKDKR